MPSKYPTPPGTSSSSQSNLWSSIRNFFSPRPIEPAGRGAGPNYYQVKSGDTFSSIAQKTGTTESQLQGINNQLVAPPRGSYVMTAPSVTPAAAPPTAGHNFGAINTTANAPYTSAGSSKRVNESVTGNTGGYSLGNFTSGGRYYDPYGGVIQTATNYKTQFDQAVKNYQLTGYADNSNLPDAMGLQVQEALGFNAQDMQDWGYTYNQNGLWVKSGTPGTQQSATGLPKGVSKGNAEGVYYIWKKGANGKWKQVRVGSRKQRRGDVGNKASLERLSNEATVAPVTTLDVRLGSG